MQYSNSLFISSQGCVMRVDVLKKKYMGIRCAIKLSWNVDRVMCFMVA